MYVKLCIVTIEDVGIGTWNLHERQCGYIIN